jgi:hypothetical protein
MRGIAISWSKDNIFQKKPFILYFIFKKKQKNQTLHWLAGHPIYGHHPRNTSRWTPEAFRGWCDHPWRFWGWPVPLLILIEGGWVGFRGGRSHLGLASGWLWPPPESLGGGQPPLTGILGVAILFGGGPPPPIRFEGGCSHPRLLVVGHPWVFNFIFFLFFCFFNDLILFLFFF